MRCAARLLIPMLTVALCCGLSSELTDAQIQAAIQRGAVTKKANLVDDIKKQTVLINHFGGDPVSKRIYVVSDSDRIALAASEAKRQMREFSLQDARAIGLGMVTVVLEATTSSGYAMSLAKWSAPDVHVVLKADDTIIQPVDKRDNTSSYFMGKIGAYSTHVFPAIEGAQKLTVIVISKDGHHKEKEADPKLFELR